MKREYYIYILLLLFNVFDAVGDGLRTQGNQIPHHIMEVLMVASLLVVWRLSKFRWHYVWLLVLTRIWAFNPLYNITAGNKINYLGDSNIYDIVIKWFGEAVKNPPENFALIFQFMALLATVALIIKGHRKTT